MNAVLIRFQALQSLAKMWSVGIEDKAQGHIACILNVIVASILSGNFEAIAHIAETAVDEANAYLLINGGGGGGIIGTKKRLLSPSNRFLFVDLQSYGYSSYHTSSHLNFTQKNTASRFS